MKWFGHACDFVFACMAKWLSNLEEAEVSYGEEGKSN